MAALARDIGGAAVGTPHKGKYSANAADIFYRGALVWIDTGGGVQVTAAAGDRVLGFSPVKQTTTAIGEQVEVYDDGEFWCPLGAGITAADEGDRLVIDASGTLNTDNIADAVAAGDITLAANDAFVGVIRKVTATQMLIALTPAVTGRLFVAVATTDPAKNIVSSTNATPIVVTVTSHGYSNGNLVTIAGHGTNTAANGTWTIANIAPNTFELATSVGNGVGGATGTATRNVAAGYGD